MKNKQDVVPRAVVTKKPPRQKVSDAEFRLRLKRITEWRKQRLADLRAKKYALKCICLYATRLRTKTHLLG